MNPCSLSFLCLLTLLGCAVYAQPSTIDTPDAAEINPQFKQYWYQGKAEIATYDLEQARYGESHKGTAVLLFSTEDFSRSKQVKLDNAHKFPSDAIAVLKFNLIKTFNTGIYQYQLMQSVFTPVEREAFPHTLKTSATVQNWSGHSFTQINLQSYKYKILTRSFLESIGDQEYQIDKLLLEDEIWNLIRINPEHLPEGVYAVLPATCAASLLATPLRAEDAELVLLPADDKTDFREYTIRYLNTGRRLTIRFAKVFPYTILQWTETFKEEGKEYTTTARLKQTILTDYGAQHRNIDAPIRKQLGLD